MPSCLHLGPLWMSSILIAQVLGDLECPNGALLSADRTPKLMSTPNYPQNYLTNQACKWVIKTDHSFDVIKLQVLESELQSSPTCGEDYGEVKDGEAVWDRVMRRWCGNLIPAVLTTTGPVAQVLFRSNKANQFKGFRLKYWTTLKSKIEYSPKKYGAVNYALFGIFGAIVSAILISIVCIYFMQKRREHFKTKMIQVAEAAKMVAAQNKAFVNGSGSGESTARTRVCSVASNQELAMTPV